MPIAYWAFTALTLLLTGLLGYGTYTTARLLRQWKPDRNLLLLPAENGVRITLVLLCVGLGYLSGLEREDLGWQFPRPTLQVILGAGVGAGLALFFFITTRTLVERTGDRFYSPLLLDHIVPRSGRELFLVLLAFLPVVVLEELLFRSLLLGGLSPLLSPWYLLPILGVIFGLFHSPQGTWGMTGAGLAGVIFGILFLWGESLLAPLVAHYIANTLQVSLAMAMKRTG